MPTIEVDELEFQNNRQLKDLVGRMLKNPDARRRVLEAQKIVEPNAAIPELDAAKPVQDAISAMSEKFDKALSELKSEREKERDEARLASLRSRWSEGQSFLKQHGYNDEGLRKVEEIMEQRGIASHEDAAKIFEFENPPPPPSTPSGSGSYNFFAKDEGTDDWKELIATRGDSESVLRKMTQKALAEGRQR